MVAWEGARQIRVGHPRGLPAVPDLLGFVIPRNTIPHLRPNLPAHGLRGLVYRPFQKVDLISEREPKRTARVEISGSEIVRDEVAEHSDVRGRRSPPTPVRRREPDDEADVDRGRSFAGVAR